MVGSPDIPDTRNVVPALLPGPLIGRSSPRSGQSGVDRNPLCTLRHANTCRVYPYDPRRERSASSARSESRISSVRISQTLHCFPAHFVLSFLGPWMAGPYSAGPECARGDEALLVGSIGFGQNSPFRTGFELLSIGFGSRSRTGEDSRRMQTATGRRHRTVPSVLLIFSETRGMYQSG